MPVPLQVALWTLLDTQGASNELVEYLEYFIQKFEEFNENTDQSLAWAMDILRHLTQLRDSARKIRDDLSSLPSTEWRQWVADEERQSEQYDNT